MSRVVFPNGKKKLKPDSRAFRKRYDVRVDGSAFDEAWLDQFFSPDFVDALTKNGVAFYELIDGTLCTFTTSKAKPRDPQELGSLIELANRFAARVHDLSR
jgi:hypothetical protein